MSVLGKRTNEVRNPLNSGEEPKVYLGFSVFFGVTALIFLFGDTPPVWAVLDFGYSILWGILAFVDLEQNFGERFKEVLFKLLMGGFILNYGVKYFL